MKTFKLVSTSLAIVCAASLLNIGAEAQVVPGTFTEWNAIASLDANGNPVPVRDFDPHITDLDRSGATGFSPDTPWYTIDNRTPGPPCALGHLEPGTNILTSWGYGSGVPVGIDVDDNNGKVWFTVSGNISGVANARIGFKFPNGATACGGPSDNCFRHFPMTGNSAGVITDASGNAYVAEIASPQNSFVGTILRITPTGNYTRWALPAGGQPRYLAFDSTGENLYFTVIDSATINRLNIVTNTLTTWSFPPPAAGSFSILDAAGIFLRSDDEIWYADTINDKVSRLTPSSNTITEFTKPGINAPSFVVFSPLILRVQALISDRFGNTIDLLEEDPALVPPDFPGGVATTVTPSVAVLTPTTVDVVPVDFERVPLSREIDPVVTPVDGIDPPGFTLFPFPLSGSQPIGITETIVSELSDGTFQVGVFGDEFGREQVFLFESPVLIAPPGTFIDLSPDTDENNEGDAHTVTALVTEGLSMPVALAGVDVTFEIVSGPNIGLTATSTTDANGEASFTYVGIDVGPAGGIDRIRGSFVDAQGTQQFDEVEKRWLDVPNEPPVADAGPDQTLQCTSPEGTTVTLDGTGSSDPDGDPLSFDWQNSFGITTGPTPTVSLPLGMQIITLTVSDGDLSDTDTVAITVEDTIPPEILADLSIIRARNDDDDDDDDDGDGDDDDDGDGDDDDSQSFLVSFSADDQCDAEPVVTATLNGEPVESGEIIVVTEDDAEDRGLRELNLKVVAVDESGNQAEVEISRRLQIDD